MSSSVRCPKPSASSRSTSASKSCSRRGVARGGTSASLSGTDNTNSVPDKSSVPNKNSVPDRNSVSDGSVMSVDRLLPTEEAADLVALTRDLADKELGTRVDEYERAETYPEGLFGVLGRAGLLGLPYPESDGGGGQPYEVYLQVLEELAARWAAVAVAVSVHGLSCYPVAAFGTD